MLALAQMQGHLLMAQELIEAGQFTAAEPHVGHPVDELYGSVAPALAAHGVAPFLPTLEQLRQQVRLRPADSATPMLLRRAQQSIDAAMGTIHPGPDGVADLVRELAQSAVEEYSSAVAGDRVVERIDYQDARGFLREALLLVRQQRQQQQGGSDWAAKENSLIAMLKALPSAMPPERTVLSPVALQDQQRRL